jgi:hypothetical protein
MGVPQVNNASVHNDPAESIQDQVAFFRSGFSFVSPLRESEHV